MKHIFISLFLLGSLFTASAQNDSLNKTPVIRDSTPVTTNSTMNNVRNDSTGSVNNSMKSDSTASMNNTMKNDSTGSMNNSMKRDSTASMNNTIKSDSTASMNNTRKSDSTGSVNNNSNINSANTNTKSNVNSSTSNSNQMSPAFPSKVSNSQNIAGQPGYASLPILESYVPADVVAKVKSKYNSVYDISSIKHTADQKAYFVRYLDNGVYKTEIIGEDGNTIQ
jgi:hypothetical protein